MHFSWKWQRYLRQVKYFNDKLLVRMASLNNKTDTFASQNDAFLFGILKEIAYVIDISDEHIPGNANH